MRSDSSKQSPVCANEIVQMPFLIYSFMCSAVYHNIIKDLHKKFQDR